MKKAAVISLTIPEIPGKSGGEIRDIYLFGYLARHYQTDYFSIHNYFGQGEPDRDFIKLFAHVYEPRMINEQYHAMVDENVRLSAAEKLRYRLSLHGRYLPGQKLPAELLGFRNEFNRYIRRFFEHCARRKKYDYVFISPQVNPAIIEDLALPDQTKVIWAMYDVEKVRHKRLLETKKTRVDRWFYRFEAAAACRFEKAAAAKSDGIIVVSDLDRRRFAKYYNRSDCEVLSVENGVDVDYFYAMQAGTDHKIVFVGNMGYASNAQAVRYFVKKVFPLIVKKYPQTHFYAVGANASQELKSLETDHVTVTGKVSDVRDYLKMAHIVCVPLLAGSGTKYKVLEAMACEKPVVTTSIGAEGLMVSDGKNIVIADTAQEMADNVIRLFEHPNRCLEIGKKAREFILANHDWNAVLPKIDAWVENLCCH